MIEKGLGGFKRGSDGCNVPSVSPERCERAVGRREEIPANGKRE